MRSRCRICHVEAEVDNHCRCRLCREAKLATDMGTSYGRMKNMIFQRFGNLPENTGDIVVMCPGCGKPFIPKNSKQKYCEPACGVRVASRNYYKRKHRRDHGPDNAHQNGGRSDQNQRLAES